ncbi:hypothetical protein NHJ13734_000118 [Beauveria thailandica]
MSTPASSSKRVKFVASDPSRGGLPVKRKQVQHACDSCRRKKRRCTHADEAGDEPSPDEGRGPGSSPSHTSPVHHARSVTPVSRTSLPLAANGLYGRQQEQSHPPFNRPNNIFQRHAQDGSFQTRSSRFVGDLNPEGMFIEATASVSARESSQKGDVGIWLPAGSGQSFLPLSLVFAPSWFPLFITFLTLRSATIETFYHAVIILSCRLPRPGTAPAASTLPPPSANARRSLAAERIACAVPRDCLSPAPFVPYAVSLALSVEYRKMRHSRLPMFRARAMSSFKRNCELLRRYSNHFWNASVVAGLGERVLKEMERAATTLNKDYTPPVTIAESDLAGSAPSMLTAGITELPLHDPDSMNAAIDSAIGMDNTVNFSLVDPVSGQDVFGHIDPSFNLDAVEDALEAHLDIGLPFTWGDWGHYAT